MGKISIKILFPILIVLIIVGICIYFAKGREEDEQYADLQDYTPQEEITMEQARGTIISLYFKDKEKDELVAEARQVDAKLLLNNPYTFLLNLLVQGPKNEQNVALIPQNTIINDAQLNGDVLNVDFSEAFIKEFQGDDSQKKLMIKSILDTLTQLNEVNKIKILIDGESNKGFTDSDVNFSEIFTREANAF